MKALLLAAGRGTRISRYLQGNPKCTVDIAGTPLLIYTINMLKKKGITDIAIVTGYRHEVIEELVAGENVKIYYNPFYDVTNSTASAWFAKDFLKNDDVMIMNADVFCEEVIYDKLLTLKESPVMLADSTRKEDADYKFYYENNRLIKYGKELTGDDITGEYVGIAKFDKSFVPIFLNKMEEMI
ncbi:MAG: phosphocholine cytidylyltransferase family protein, partial [Lachnospiraceae bacterium]|nr:phosphocholine cytidylyltransferase family protein [Lachnospiraceae bacterium]